MEIHPNTRRYIEIEEETAIRQETFGLAEDDIDDLRGWRFDENCDCLRCSRFK